MKPRSHQVSPTLSSVNRSQSEVADPFTLQQAFMDAMAPGLVAQIFEGLDNILFFIKNRDGRFIQIVEGARFGPSLRQPSTLVGLTDFDLFPRQVASRIRADDLRVMESTEAIRGIVEMLINPARSSVGWHVTNKYPVKDRDGEVIGVMGTVQRLEDRVHPLVKGTRIDELIERIRRNPTHDYTLEELGRLAGMSSRHLGRHFHQAIGMPPRKFITLCRLNLACQMLIKPRKLVAEIAQDCGFYDQSAFTLQCRKATGMTPLEYRKWVQRVSCQA